MTINSQFIDYQSTKSDIRALASNVVSKIHQKFKQLGRPVKIMHVCGTHEATVSRSGIRAMLPKGLRIIAGPGCPVCVCPADHISKAAALAADGYVITTFGDMFKVPDADLQTLAQIRAQGNDVRIVYSVLDAISQAKKEPDEDFVWLGVGFETTAPMTSFSLEHGVPDNFYVLSDFRLVPPALDFLLDLETFDLDGFILPGHVTTVMGYHQYLKYPRDYQVACVVAGFDPLDFLIAIDHMLDEISKKSGKVINCYPRAVSLQGNVKAQESITKVFESQDAKWRGIGMIENSGLVLKTQFQDRDANQFVDLHNKTDADLPRGCKCGGVILGQVEPEECPHFLRRCTPETAIGPCMVSDEGTCRIRATYQNISKKL